MKEWVSRLLLVAGDALSFLLSFLFAYWIWDRYGHPIGKPLEFYLPPLSIGTVILLGIFMSEGLYSHRYDFWHEARLILKGVGITFLLLLLYLGMSHTLLDYSRGVLLLGFAFSTLLLLFGKRYSKFLLHRLGIWAKPARIYEEDPLLEKEIYGNPYLGYVRPRAGRRADTLLLNPRAMDARKLEALIEGKLREYREVLFVPLLNSFDLTHSRIYELANVPSNLIGLRNRLNQPVDRFVKRSAEWCVTVAGLPLWLPLLAALGLWIRLREPGWPILFRQTRIGKDGEPFVCLKFRTMRPDGEEILRDYLREHPEEAEYYRRYHKYRHDPRVTAVGRNLRRYSLDELPQLVNVLRGEMSLIGPRPYLPEELEELGEAARAILVVPPGITGLWQVSGRNRIDFARRVEIDRWYIRNWNLWLDLTILLKTFKVLLTREGAS